tara:strand:+ start:819 stop:1682 length:864 start_codon:yes stop_codon:yes gene_type:complete
MFMHLEIDKNKIKIGLYVVSTPIGNLGDITYRAIEILKNSDIIICEDTRVTKKLTNYFKIHTNLIPNHKFNERKNVEKFLKLLNSGKIVSLISDAGTPSISDPGKILINACIKNSIRVIPIPGASAVTAAMSVSGFSDNFFFQGFLSDKVNEINDQLKFLADLKCSIVFFISSKKINRIIPILKKFFLKRQIVICREISKIYEEFIRCNVNDLKSFSLKLKGEITVVISNEEIRKKVSKDLSESDKIIIKKLINKLSVKDIIEIIENKNRMSKSLIYDYCIKLKNEK